MAEAAQTLRITGMTCASCVATIERSLRATPGVEHATVNLATGLAQVQAPPTVTRASLVEAVKASGYNVKEGTTFEPEKPDQKETRRFIVAAALTIPLVAIAMGPHIAMLLGIDSGMGGMDMEGMDMSGMEGMEGMEGMDMEGGDMEMGTPYPWLQFALAAPVVAVGGFPFLRGAWNAYRTRHLTMDVLVATGVLTAFLYSTAVILWPGLDTGQGVYFETAAVVVTLLLLGRRIEAGAQRRARATLARLAGRDPAAGQLLADAQTSRMAAQAAVDRLVRYFVPTVLVIAIAASLFWMTLGQGIAMDAGFTPSSMGLMSLIAVLIIACPCALGLAVPMAVLNGTSRGAEHGIFLRGAKAVQATHGITTIAFSKTGVLTMGHPEVTDVHPIGRTEAEVLALAGAVERDAKHPVGIAIHRRAEATSMPATTGFVEAPASGAQATIDGTVARVGTLDWLAANGIATDSANLDAKRLREAGKTVVGVSHGDQLVGLLATSDAVRPSARHAIEALKAKGADVVLLSSDHAATAGHLAHQLGIRIMAGLTHDQQVAAISEMKTDGRVAVVATAQDTTLLTAADLSVALGAGSSGADVVLTTEDLNGVPAALDLGHVTLRKVRQNLAWAFGYNIVLIPVAAGLLVAWPLFGEALRLDPMLAGVAMVLSITSVLLNSLALRRWRPEPAIAMPPSPGFPIGSGNPVKA